ncbi:MAG: DEAD/DEAH box helicase [Fibrobacterales bacterium]
MKTFAESELRSEILEGIAELGFEKPTPIQAESIPHVLHSDQDLIAFAQTGTGKTAAFGLPSVQLTDVKDKQTQTIILCPTRELCNQITKDLKNFCKYIRGLNVVAVYGGASIETQIKEIKRGAQIVVGTPGRTNDLLRRKVLKLGSIKRLILDEADEMLNMGFKEELDSILETIPDTRQTLLFSATMPKGIVSITKKYMDDPLEISVAAKNTGATNVTHHYYMVQAKDRYEVLKRIADKNPNIYGIVFCRTRRETQEVASKLIGDGYNADALHGDLSQGMRDEAMDKFRKGHLQLLVATDVAARGLDVNSLTHVINYNLPDDAEIYTHRSGRTGRAGNHGTSIVIIHSREKRRIQEIEKMSKITFSKEMVPTGQEVCQAQLYSLIDTVKKVEVSTKQIEPFLDTIYNKLETLSREELIQHFVSAEFNRFLKYYKNARDINVEESGRREKNPRDKKSKEEKRSNTDFAAIKINVGREEKINPAQLMGLVNEALNSGQVEVGRIAIQDNSTLFEVDKKHHGELMNVLGEFYFNDEPLKVEEISEMPEGRPRGRSGGGFKGGGSRGGGDRSGRREGGRSGGDRSRSNGPRGDKRRN